MVSLESYTATEFCVARTAKPLIGDRFITAARSYWEYTRQLLHRREIFTDGGGLEARLPAVGVLWVQLSRAISGWVQGSEPWTDISCLAYPLLPLEARPPTLSFPLLLLDRTDLTVTLEVRALNGLCSASTTQQALHQRIKRHLH